MTPAAILPALSLLKWPATVTGAVLVFGLSTEGTLSLVSTNAHRLTTPVAARQSISVPPTRQIASLSPFIVDEPKPATAVEPAPVQQVMLRTPVETPMVQPTEAVAPPALSASIGMTGMGRIGSSAVNLRAGPSKTSARIGVLQAGAAVRIGQESGGWVHVAHEDGDGWVYSSYLDSGSTTSITVRGGSDAIETPSITTVEIGSRLTAREDPQAASASLFRLEPGERVKIVDRQGSWLKIITVTGETGWVRAG